MKRMGSLAVVLIFAVWAGDLLAQGRGRGRSAEGFGLVEASAPAPRTLLQLEGEVERVNLAAGWGNSSVLVGGNTVLLAPSFHLERHGFSVEPGDWIRAEAFESPGRGNFLVATKVLNVTRNQTADLRDESGRPLWTTERWGGRGRFARGPCGGVVRDVESAETFTGTVAEVGAETGPRYPRITLDDGRTFAAGAYRAWMDQGFTVSPGDEIEVTAYPCATGSDRWVAMAVTNRSTGEELQLRDEAGFPLQAPRGRGARGFGHR